MDQVITPQQLCAKFGSPLYVYDQARIEQQCQTLLSALQKAFPQNAEVLYACKANTNPHILKLIRENGIHGIDAVSPFEIEVALRAGFSPEQIMYTANFISEDEISYALSKGVLLNVGELQTLKRLIPHKARVVVRLNLDIGFGHHSYTNTGGAESKFGIHFSLKEEILRAQEAGLQIIGVHEHMGSQLLRKDEGEYLQGIEQLFRAALELNLPSLELIDIGGGFGIRYQKGEEICDLENLFERVRVLYDKYFPSKRPKLCIEPGRYLVAESGRLLCTVTEINEGSKKVFVGTDSGMNHLIRPALYESYHEIVNSVQRENARLVTVCGNICESGDILGRDRTLAAEVGDILVIENAGAYGYSMASNYNMRGRPAEALYKNIECRLIRRRENLDDLLMTVCE